MQANPAQRGPAITNENGMVFNDEICKFMRMHNPPHPGEIVKEECLVPLRLAVTEGAKALGVTRQTLSNLINGRAGVSPEMAIRLEKAFGGNADTWLRLQVNFDLWNVRQREDDIHVERYAG